MKNSNYHIDDLIAKHFAGETNSSEEKLLSAWLEKEENRKRFDSLHHIYMESALISERVEVDTDAAWLKVKERMHRRRRISPAFAVMRIAAIFLLLTGIAAVIYIMRREEVKPVMVMTGNEKKEVLLPDSSIVFLNKNSSVQYAYSDDERTILMTGEVFFEVRHEQRSFTVNAGGLVVRDIGTEFNVDARNAEKVDVIVADGAVELHAEQIAPVKMIEGQRCVYVRSTKKLERLSVADPNALAYKTKIFVFENASLPAVIEKINEVYDTSISIGDNLKQCRITSTFKNESVDTILQVIADVLHLKITKKDSTILLEGQGCE